MDNKSAQEKLQNVLERLQSFDCEHRVECLVTAFRVRFIVTIKPNGPKAGIAGSDHVEFPGVADDHSVGGGKIKLIQCAFEEGRMGFSQAEITADDHGFKGINQSAEPKFFVLLNRQAIRDYGKLY